MPLDLAALIKALNENKTKAKVLNPFGNGVLAELESLKPQIMGDSAAQIGVWGKSVNGIGVVATSSSPTRGAVVAVGKIAAEFHGKVIIGTSLQDKVFAGLDVNGDATFDNILADNAFVTRLRTDADADIATDMHIGGKLNVVGQAQFSQDIEVKGDLRLVNADVAEEFPCRVDQTAEPGSVMVLKDENGLELSQREYDKSVAGVVCGAGCYKPGIILDSSGLAASSIRVALMGKVNCLADATYGSIAVGDLLTTSQTAGHAMRATDPKRSFGSILGKAMQPLPEGRGVIPVLVMLG